MSSMEAYPRAAMERAMKVQDVMLQAMAKKITWWQAAEILGISDRHMRRWREGYDGLLDRRRGGPLKYAVCRGSRSRKLFGSGWLQFGLHAGFASREHGQI